MRRPMPDIHRAMQRSLLLLSQRHLQPRRRPTRRYELHQSTTHVCPTRRLRSLSKVLRLLVQHKRRSLHESQLGQTLPKIPLIHLPTGGKLVQTLPLGSRARMCAALEKRRLWRVSAKSE